MHKPVTFGLVLVLAAVAACGDSKSDSSTFGNTSNGTAGKGGGAAAGSAGSGTAGGGTGGTSSGKGGSAGTGIIATGGNGTGAGSGACTTDPDVDQDKDGWTGAQGDCNDCDPNVNPGAMDVVNYMPAGGGAGGAGGSGMKVPLPDDQQVDEDCDGKKRLPSDDVTCDGALAIDSNDPFDAAKAMELCQKAEENPTDPKAKKWGVTKAGFAAISGAPFTPKPPSVGMPELSYGIVPTFGAPTKPQGGKAMFVISAGEARAPGQKGYDAASVCSWNKGYSSGYPTGFPKQGTCGTTGEPHDGAALDLNIRVPTNAKTMKFNFRFFSCEYPQFTCSTYNDVFAALMFPDPLPMGDPMSPNIAFENTASGKKNVIGVNNESFFTACTAGAAVKGNYPNCKGETELKGSGFEGHAASAWLESQVPVKPGSVVTLRLAIWDSADGVLDSTAVVDNFQFLAEEGTGVGTVIVPDPHLADTPLRVERTAGAIARWLAIGLAVLLSIISLSPPPALPADAPPELASAGRAMALVAKLAALPHPRRTAEHDRVRDRVVSELAALGMSPIVSRTTGEDGHPIDNVLARRAGTRPGGRALMLAAHYDSVPAGPGAGDDAHGVAVILETLRALSTLPPLPNDVVVLITDAEEEGLFGARAFASAHPWAKDVSVVLNFEARGSTGPAAMFEVTRQNGFLVDALAHAGVRRPVATSLTGEVYRRMPNDTDLTVFARAGMAGMNFAFADGVARYHTARDRADELDPRSVQHQLDYALPLVRALGAADLSTPRAPDRVFFAVGPWLVRYPARFALGLAIAVSGLFGLLLGADVRRGLVRVQDVALAAVSVLTFVLLGSAVGSLVEQLAQLVARDPVRARGIDSLAPDVERLGLGLAVVAVVGLAMAELARRLPPAAVVRGALAPVALLALVVAFTGPGASHVLVWPLAAATAALALERAGTGAASFRGIASGALAAVPAYFWAGLVQVLFIALGLAGAGLVGGVIAVGVAMIAPAFLGAGPASRRASATLAALAVLGALLAVVGAVSAARA